VRADGGRTQEWGLGDMRAIFNLRLGWAIDRFRGTMAGNTPALPEGWGVGYRYRVGVRGGASS
jgi:hypothetical protein